MYEEVAEVLICEDKLKARIHEMGHQIMRGIAAELPEDRRGYYSTDPAIREAARGTEIYPWENVAEV